MPILVSERYIRANFVTFVQRTRRQHINLAQVRYNDECLATKPKKVVSYAVDELLALTVFLVIFGFCISCTITVTNCGQSRKKLKEQKQLYRVNCEHTEQKDAQHTALHIAQR